MAEYPLDHGLGYAAVPRDARNFEPLVRDRLAFVIWTLLHLHARSTPGHVTQNGVVRFLERGQSALTLTRLATRLGVDRKTVRRKLDRLENWGLVSRKGDNSGTVETLPYYGEYGVSVEQGAQQKGQPSPHGSPHGSPQPSPQQKGQPSPHEGTVNGPDGEPETENGHPTRAHAEQDGGQVEGPEEIPGSFEGVEVCEVDPSPEVCDVLEAFVDSFGPLSNPTRYVSVVEKALQHYEPLQLQLVIWHAAGYSAKAKSSTTPRSLFRLSSPHDQHALADRLDCAMREWRAVDARRPYPWEHVA